MRAHGESPQFVSNTRGDGLLCGITESWGAPTHPSTHPPSPSSPPQGQHMSPGKLDLKAVAKRCSVWPAFSLPWLRTASGAPQTQGFLCVGTGYLSFSCDGKTAMLRERRHQGVDLRHRHELHARDVPQFSGPRSSEGLRVSLSSPSAHSSVCSAMTVGQTSFIIYQPA